MTNDQLRAILERLNNLYGAGEILFVLPGFVRIKKFMCAPEWARYAIVDGEGDNVIVKFRGHQMSIKTLERMIRKRAPAPTKVIYRRFPGKFDDVIALFPEIPSTRDILTCQSYQHVGQHGTASVQIAQWTNPVKADDPDVLELERELEGLGYASLERRKKFTRANQRERARIIAEYR